MYKEIYCPKHNRAKSNGMVREHILIAEKKLKRFLKEGECVHHIDENKLNNSMDNLMVFKTNKDHITYHKSNNFKLVETQDGSFICEKYVNICPICGEKTLNKKYCSTKCRDIAQRKVKRPNKEDLKQLLIENNFSKVGKLYRVSDNTVRKWCKNYGMSTKAKDYK